MSVTPASIAARFPDLPGVSDSGLVQLKIDEAKLQCSETEWGDLYELGVSYLTAHLMAIQKSGASTSGGGGTPVAGPITGETVGDQSRSYGGPAAGGSGTGDASLDSTVYGREYKRLQRIVIKAPIVG